jgi:hypothetical protein
MKPWLFLGLFVLFSVPGFADMPQLQFDGTYSKESPYKDPHPYSPMDFRAAAKNPLQLGMKKKLGLKDEGFADLEAKIQAFPRKEANVRLLQTHRKEVRREFDLTEKEKNAHAKSFWEFYKPDPPKKREFVSQVLTLGNKEYPFEHCSFAGEGDLNGDGVKEILVIWHDPATHAGAHDGFRLFDENGAFLWSYAPAPYVPEYAILDVDQDNRDEFLFTLGSGENREVVVIGCPKAGETLPLPPNSPISQDLDKEMENQAPIPTRDVDEAPLSPPTDQNDGGMPSRN